MSTPNETAGAAPSQIFTPEMVLSYRRMRAARIRLTPEILAHQLEQFEGGRLREFALTADWITRRDDRVSVAWPKRCKAVSRRAYSVQINDGLPDGLKKRAKEHQAALKYAYDNCTAAHALDLDQQGGFRLLARQMMEAVGVHYAVHELVWQPRIVDGRPRMTFTARFVPLWFFESTTGRLRFLRNYFGWDGEDMVADEWLVTIGENLMEPLAIAAAFKRMTLIDWLAYSEKFGMPGLLGKTGAQKDSPGWLAMREAVEKFAQDWGAVCSKDESIDLVEAKGGGSNLPYPPLVDRMDRAIVSICRGGDLSTMSQQGDSSGSNRQQEETEVLEEDDAAMITETLQKISRFIIRELFDEEPLAYLSIDVPRTKDTQDTLKKVDGLMRYGVPVASDWLRSELGVPAPAENANLLLAPAAPAFGVGLPGELAAANAAELAAAGRDALFKTHAQAQDLAAKRPVYRPIAERLAAMLAAPDPTALRALAERFRAEAPVLYRYVLAQAPDLAKPAELAIGTALVSGFAEAAKARSQASQTQS